MFMDSPGSCNHVNAELLAYIRGLLGERAAKLQGIKSVAPGSGGGGAPAQRHLINTQALCSMQQKSLWSKSKAAVAGYVPVGGVGVGKIARLMRVVRSEWVPHLGRAKKWGAEGCCGIGGRMLSNRQPNLSARV